jgi:adenylate kinase family enzyme
MNKKYLLIVYNKMISFLDLHNGKYFSDGYNQYYKKINSYTLKKISKKEFYEKSKYNPKIINKLLYKSIYPTQLNDYILLRYPKWINNYQTIKLNINRKYVPADYQLANLIKFFWKNKIITLHWNQPKNKFGGIGSIDVKKRTLNNKNVIDIFVKLFGDKNIIIYDCKKNPKLIKYTENVIHKNKNKIIIFTFSNHIHIQFLEKKLKWMHKKLNINIPKKKESSKGGIILYEEEIKSCKII